ncbi:hypothetical protein BD779DRAFT_1567414 [Infundibulicybe gibba]|nr:hypothetical protein BD779DRAFT_1567414 [Infundibulicybe gibba]
MLKCVLTACPVSARMYLEFTRIRDLLGNWLQVYFRRRTPRNPRSNPKIELHSPLKFNEHARHPIQQCRLELLTKLKKYDDAKPVAMEYVAEKNDHAFPIVCLLLFLMGTAPAGGSGKSPSRVGHRETKVIMPCKNVWCPPMECGARHASGANKTFTEHDLAIPSCVGFQPDVHGVSCSPI